MVLDVQPERNDDEDDTKDKVISSCRAFCDDS